MLSVYQIERSFGQRQLEAILRGVSSNGLGLPAPLVVRLSQQPAAAIALGLRRVVELTYGPTTLSRQMTTALRERQRADGSFGADRPDPLATAAAIDALGRVINEQPGDSPHTLADARDRAVAALAAMQQPDGPFGCPDDRTEQDRALAAAFVLFLLIDDDAFRQTVRLADLLNWFDDRSDRLDNDTQKLRQLAYAGASATADSPTTLVAAIAA